MAARLTGYLVVAIVATTLIAGLIVGAQRDDTEGPVDLIVQNAAVYTADRRGSMAEAIAVRGNQILRVGSRREIARLQRPQTVVLDARGGAVLPGFNDSHVRLTAGGLALQSLDLTAAESAGETLDLVSAWSAANPDRQWIVGRGWSPEHFRNGLPSRHLLDAVVADRPALLFDTAQRISWANSEALRLAGIRRGTPDPAGGAIVREASTGEPSGVLQGSAADLITRLIPPASRQERADALRAAIAEANALGITSVQTVEESPDALELYSELRRAGDLTIRIYSALPVREPLDEEHLVRLDEIRKAYPDDPLFKTGALWIRLDASAVDRAAGMLERYEHSIGSRERRMAADDLERTVRLADAAGWQVIIHATGERGVREALDAYAHAARSNGLPERGRRHRIEGVAAVHEADIDRLAALGIVASMQPAPSTATARGVEGVTRSRDAERWGRTGETVGAGHALTPRSPARTQALRRVASETRVVLGSGWPDCPLDPLLRLQVAVSQAPDGTPDASWSATQPVPLKTAIDAYTSTASWASFDEQRKGSIAAGMLADLVVLSEDIFAMPAERLSTVSVAATIMDGKIVYQRLASAETEPAGSALH